MTSNIWCQIGGGKGKPRGRGGEGPGGGGCTGGGWNCDKQGSPALSDVTGGRRGGWEEEERGRKGSGLRSPEPGDTQMLADGMRRIVESNGSWLPGNTAQSTLALLTLGKPLVEGEPAKLRRLRASHTSRVEGGVGKAGISPAPSCQPQLQCPPPQCDQTRHSGSSKGPSCSGSGQRESHACAAPA